jgi:iron complex outermembrane receptor protein
MRPFAFPIILAALSGTAITGLAAAQAQTARQTGTTSTGDIEEIIVTAERRATSLQSTPLSILALTQDAVEAKGIQDLQDLSTSRPISASRRRAAPAPAPPIS